MEIYFLKSHNAKKLSDPLVSPGIVGYAGKRIFFGLVPWANLQFKILKLQILNYFGHFRCIEKKNTDEKP